MPVVFCVSGFVAVSCGDSQRNVEKRGGERRGESGAPVVAVARVARENLSREIVFDAEFRPSQDVELHARAAGFVRQMYVDVGDRVQEGQVISEIEIPEFEEDLQRAVAVRRRAEADVKKAEEDIRRAESEMTRAQAGIKRLEAAHEEAVTTFQRLQSVSQAKPGLVAQQEIDVARSRERTAAAAVEEAHAVEGAALGGVSAARAAALSAQQGVLIAEADVARLESKRASTRITAPFSGVITKRFSDVGDLVRGGLSPSTPALPLVRLVAVDLLRLVFPVSASYVVRVKAGAPVSIYLPALERILTGKVARVAGEMEAATRSMEAQIEVPNPDGDLLPGMFANVRIAVDARQQVLTVPQTALSRGNPRTVAWVSEKCVMEERVVKLGLETAIAAEVLSGVGENDLVIVGSRNQLKTGQSVEPKEVQTPSYK